MTPENQPTSRHAVGSYRTYAEAGVDPLVSGLALAFYGLSIGAATGVVLELLTHALSGGRRNLSSTGSVSARSYEVVADDPHDARRAAEMLAGRQLQGV